MPSDSIMTTTMTMHMVRTGDQVELGRPNWNG